MMADYDMLDGQADQADLYYRHNSSIENYFESFIPEEFESEPKSVGVSKKNQGGSCNLDYMYLRMDH